MGKSKGDRARAGGGWDERKSLSSWCPKELVRKGEKERKGKR
jgi:hypothetical protein